MRFNEPFYQDDECYLPQIVVAGENKKAFGWFPGKKEHSQEEMVRAIDNRFFTGFTGKYYKSYLDPKDDQEYYRLWVGIDIDDVEINEETLETTTKCVKDSAREIRLSRSGNGVHVIFECEPTLLKGKDSKIVKNTLQPFVDSLESHNVPVCKYDGGVFYLFGGLNGVVKQFNHGLKIALKMDSKCDPLNYYDIGESEENTFDQDFSIEDYSPVGVELMEIFKKYIEGFSYGNYYSRSIYLKQWYDMLKDTKYEFETKSPMSSGEWHVNGLIFIKGRNLKIYSFADSGIVFDEVILY